MSDPQADVTINESMVACYGTTEYSEDMSGITLTVRGDEEKQIRYEYKCREESLKGASEAAAVIPAIRTRASMRAEDRDATGYIREGYAFSPMFTLGYTVQITGKEEFTTWLSLEREN